MEAMELPSVVSVLLVVLDEAKPPRVPSVHWRISVFLSRSSCLVMVYRVPRPKGLVVLAFCQDTLLGRYEPEKYPQKPHIVHKTQPTRLPVIKIGSRWIVGFDREKIDKELARKAL
jgi:hypothetical protein